MYVFGGAGVEKYYNDLYVYDLETVRISNIFNFVSKVGLSLICQAQSHLLEPITGQLLTNWEES